MSDPHSDPNLDSAPIERGQMNTIDQLVELSKAHEEKRIEDPSLPGFFYVDGRLVAYHPKTIQQFFADPTTVDHVGIPLGRIVAGIGEDGSEPIDSVMGKHRDIKENSVEPNEEHLRLKSIVINFIAEKQRGIAQKSSQMLEELIEEKSYVNEKGKRMVELVHQEVLKKNLQLILGDMWPGRDWSNPDQDINVDTILQKISDNMTMVGGAFYKLSLAAGDPEKSAQALNEIMNDPAMIRNQEENRKMIETLLAEENARKDIESPGLAKRMSDAGFDLGTITTSIFSTLTASFETNTGAIFGGLSLIGQYTKDEDNIWKTLVDSRERSHKGQPNAFSDNLKNFIYLSVGRTNALPALNEITTRDVEVDGVIVPKGTPLVILTDYGIRTSDHPAFAGSGLITQEYFDETEGAEGGKLIALDKNQETLMRTAWAIMSGSTDYNKDPVGIMCPGIFMARGVLSGWFTRMIDRLDFVASNGLDTRVMYSTSHMPHLTATFEVKDQDRVQG
jgi:cytochrome P450